MFWLFGCTYNTNIYLNYNAKPTFTYRYEKKNYYEDDMIINLESINVKTKTPKGCMRDAGEDFFRSEE